MGSASPAGLRNAPDFTSFVATLAQNSWRTALESPSLLLTSPGDGFCPAPPDLGASGLQDLLVGFAGHEETKNRVNKLGVCYKRTLMWDKSLPPLPPRLYAKDVKTVIPWVRP